MSMRIDLLSNQAADSAVKVVSPGGRFFWFSQATWGAGGGLKLQIAMPDGTTYGDIDGAVMEADGMKTVDLPAGATIKAVRLATPTAISSWLVSA